MNNSPKNYNSLESKMLDAMWSEHCSYRSSKVHLKRLHTRGKRVVFGPGENAGAIDIGSGKLAVFKMESHNHPSFIDPYPGAATGVGGIIRDILAMGARPVAVMDALFFGDVQQPHQRHLINGVVRGIGDYGNCMGIPNVGGYATFSPYYNENILVNAMCVGVVSKEDAVRATTRPGLSLMYAGSPTGRDGIHGAMMASNTFRQEEEDQRPAVQIGDPFSGKILMEACLEANKTGAIFGMQDMGAAGLLSSSSEMAYRGGTGMEIDLDAIPTRTGNMRPEAYLLSETQERMLLSIEERHLLLLSKIFDHWNVPFVSIGQSTDNNLYEVLWKGKRVAQMPVEILTASAPTLKRPMKMLRPSHPHSLALKKASVSSIDALVAMFSCGALSSRRWIRQQYDASVGGRTIGASHLYDASVVAPPDSPPLAMVCVANPYACYNDPYYATQGLCAEAWRRLSATGAYPVGFTNCLNFGNPEDPIVMGSFSTVIDALTQGAQVLDMPVVSGNVSFYNTTDQTHIPPTPVLGALGILEHDHNPIPICPPVDQNNEEDDVLLLVGNEGENTLETSLYADAILKQSGGSCPKVLWEEEKRTGQALRALLTTTSLCKGARAVAIGGIGAALADVALSNKRGLVYDGECTPPVLFSETHGRYLVVCSQRKYDDAFYYLKNRGSKVKMIATLKGSSLVLGDASIEVSMLNKISEKWLPRVMMM